MAFHGGKDRLVYWAVQLACFSPILIFVLQAFTGGLTANPIEFVLRQLGVWGLRLLVVGLALTPVARLLRQPGLTRYRRAVGLWAFTYVCLHLTTYIGVDQLFDWRTIGKDIVKRPYITIGMAAFVLLIPLAVTSMDRLTRRLGPRRWKRLHQLTYMVAPLGVVHYYLLVKADHRPPLVYGAVVLALLGYRLANGQIERRRAAARKAAKDAGKSQPLRA
ncbi:MAG: protein-methionine-sulfoxide reductase heme-binding subunit MsrQ [Caulobacteraceae bacterium]|nr:protein-methionine-sulfoxide reductase heme-binding subunit MsrQ [Caulobacteraceae bacterium]